MKETPRAQQAFNDYLAMGDDRSLEKLCERYCSATENPPTRRLMTLKDWSRDFGWQTRLTEIAERERAAIVAEGIANRQNRIDRLNDMWGRLNRVVEARAADQSMASVPGGKEGVQVRSYKFSPTGGVYEEYAVDTGLLKELRDTEKQAAVELGQWEEKSSIAQSVLIREYGVNVEGV